MKYKNWFREYIIFDSKSEFIIIMLLVFIVGVIAGYAWRVFQFEPLISKEFDIMQRQILVLEKEKRIIMEKYADLETQLYLIKSKNKRKK